MSGDVKTIFHEVCGLTPAERKEYYLRHGTSDDARAEVESLLAHDGAWDTSFINRVVPRVEAWIRNTQAGTSLGPFQLQRLLGGGGMGDVYLAHRTDGEVQQTVAIKFLRVGMDSPAVRERFLRERQILASLRHPGIAHFLDAGHTEQGQPFLVMEFVDGTAIDEYSANFTIRQKLELFLQVCEAVSYAHRNLIVHRDLKPSNILVDSAGRARLLDFGIARILDDNAGQTQTRERMLTPEYASPEQVRGMAQTTATDIYSLGAVLYKLLTGQPPHPFDPNSGEDIEWTICTREPTAAGNLNPAIPKDIDAILAMTLRKEPESRYGTVEMLMEDIRAFLEFRPVRARSMDSWYRTARFLRRFWLPAAAACIAIAGLATGLVIAQRQRALAERRFNEVRHLANQLLDVDVIVRQLPGSSAARQYIVNTSLDYLRRLSQDAASDPGLALELGTAYMRVGRVQGIPISPNLGQAENAEQSLRTAEKLIRSVLARNPENRTAILRAAQIAHDRMILAQERRPDTEALPLTRTSAQWLTRFLDSVEVNRMELPDAEAAVIVGINVANGFSRDNLLDDASRILRRTIDLAVATSQPRQAGAARIVLARTLRAGGDLDAALSAIREARALVQPPSGQTSLGLVNSFALTLITEGEILGDDEAINLGRPAEAIPLFERGYRMAVELANRDAKDALSRMAVASRGFRYAGALRHKDPEGALRVCDEILRYCAEVKDNSRARRSEARAMSLSSRILVSLRRTAEARKRLDNAYARLRGIGLYPAATVELGSEAADALRASAELEAASGALPQAIETYTRLLNLIVAGKPNVEAELHSAYRLADHYSTLASLYRHAGEKDQAAALESRRLELWRAWERKLPQNPFVLRQLARAH